MKILYVATIGGFMPFFKTIIKRLLDEGHAIDIATNMTQYPLPEYYAEWGCGVYQISCSRSPLNSGNYKAIKEIRKIVEEGKYDIVHCHTPIAAACTRIACRRARENGTKVIYTAHGFHFYSGAPLKNWLLFYPVEKICSHWTDALITINKEDYDRAVKKFRINKIEYVPGVGIDVNRFVSCQIDVNEKRRELGIPLDAYVLLSVGELNENKNHRVVVMAIAENENKSIHYVIAGKGNQKENLLAIAEELNIQDRLHLIGYRNDIPELYKMANLYILPSIREGLNVSLMEAMASGLPCLCGDIRGNRDLIDNCGGDLFSPLSVQDVSEKIKGILHFHKESEMGAYNQKKSETFNQDRVIDQVRKIYIETIV